MAVDPQRNRVTLENPAVLEREHVEAVRLRLGVALLDAVDKGLGIDQLALHVLDQTPPPRGIVVLGDKCRGKLPDLLESAIVRDDLAVEIDDEDAVCRGLQRRLEHRNGERIRAPTGFLRPRLRLRLLREGRATGRHAPNLWVQAPVTRLTGDGVASA